MPVAAFIAPGHPLLDATIDLILEQHGQVLKQGAILVDEATDNDQMRVLFYLEQAVQDGRVNRHGTQQLVSKRLHFVEVGPDGKLVDAGAAPYLDYRSITDGEREAIADDLNTDWLRGDLEGGVTGYAIEHIIPKHVEEIRGHYLPLIAKTEQEVQNRLKREVAYWDRRAEDLKAQEQAGKTPKLHSAKARQTAEDLAARLDQRMAELARQKDISAVPPVIKGGCLVIPISLVRQRMNQSPSPEHTVDAAARKAIEMAAMNTVMAAEENLGNIPEDVSGRNLGWDIESRMPDGTTRFIEVKGKVAGKTSVTISRNELIYGLNKGDHFIVALVIVNGAQCSVHYLRGNVAEKLDFAETGRNFDLDKLVVMGGEPA